MMVLVLLLLVGSALLEPPPLTQDAPLRTLEMLAAENHSAAFNLTLALYVAGPTPGAALLGHDPCAAWYGH